MPAKFYAVSPIYNKTCSLASASAVSLGDSASISSLGHEFLGLLVEKKSPLSDFLDSKTKAFIHEVPENFNELDLKREFNALGFALNLSSDGAPALLGETYIIKKIRKATVKSILPAKQIFSMEQIKEEKFKLRKQVTPGHVRESFLLSQKAIIKNKTLSITLSRFSSALCRTDKDDFYIDLAVALESVIKASSEIAFRFAILNTIISESDVTRRHAVYKLLKKFYNARSKIVHGAIKEKDYLTKPELDKIVAIAKLAILYKVKFFNKDEPNLDWDGHQTKLILGQDTALW